MHSQVTLHELRRSLVILHELRSFALRALDWPLSPHALLMEHQHIASLEVAICQGEQLITRLEALQNR